DLLEDRISGQHHSGQPHFTRREILPVLPRSADEHESAEQLPLGAAALAARPTTPAISRPPAPRCRCHITALPASSSRCRPSARSTTRTSSVLPGSTT